MLQITYYKWVDDTYKRQKVKYHSQEKNNNLPFAMECHMTTTIRAVYQLRVDGELGRPRTDQAYTGELLSEPHNGMLATNLFTQLPLH